MWRVILILITIVIINPYEDLIPGTLDVYDYNEGTYCIYYFDYREEIQEICESLEVEEDIHHWRRFFP